MRRAPFEATHHGHIPVWDPPAAMPAADRWTCACGATVIDYLGNVYGSATQEHCPNRSAHGNCATCRRSVVRDDEHMTAYGYVHEHSGVQFCDSDAPGYDKVAFIEKEDPSKDLVDRT